MQRFATTLLAMLSLLFFSCHQLQAAPKYLFKIATLAPAGSVWIEQFDNFAKEVAEKTGGEVSFRMYPGGVMGDDQSMYRKMRVGQLHGGGFTMTGISAFVPDFRVLSIPFLFDSYAEVDYVKEGLTPTFKERFREKGLEYIAMTEVGFIYAMSTQPIATFAILKNSKNWSPAGDPVSEAYLSTLGISPVQLSIPDVLTSLQSGLVETVYNSFYGSIVLQWFTKARYIADIPYGYAYGVFALDGKSFARLPATHRKAIEAAARNHFPVLLQKTRESNSDSRQVLEKRGCEFLKVDQETSQILREKTGDTVKLLVPDSLSKDIYDQTIGLRDTFRKTTPATGAN
ncbi:TRAP transporter substrate-binding protein DctP [Desulfopila sp. IMCC35006]|uniref:TRAP transporter substrate-binding protein n=1 Tax=Desulfopila sp. IMCC35006 TaxID=2569542 RepID=UPI0010AD1476|nr:TRAP transporter substrate-binding protein DctP [Desulfopila sp. IMCC35006]TKB24247.1 TRAP transporter substrate-binding protein DctP [Desulfopila sp. IMCC35006]